MTPALLDGLPCPATFPADDPVLWTGMGVFETLRTYGRAPFRVALHLDRLAASAAWMGVPLPDRDALAADLIAAAAAIPGESKLNILLTGGGHRLVRASPLDPARVGAPLRVATRPWSPPPWLPGRVKHTSRAAWELAARDAGVDEVLWVTPDGDWTEANRSNVFVVRDGVVLTPPDDGRILQGVTRDGLIEAGRAAGITVHETRVAAGPCDELYLCSTLKELAPVVELDGQPAAGAGPVGARLHAAFLAYFRDDRAG